MYKVIRNEVDGLDMKAIGLDGSDTKEDGQPRTWRVQPIIEQPIIDRTSAVFKKYMQNPTINYVCEYPEANELVRSVAKTHFNHKTENPEVVEQDGSEAFGEEGEVDKLREERMKRYWEQVVNGRHYAVRDYVFGPDQAELKYKMERMNDRQRSDYLKLQKQQEHEFDGELRKFIDKANRIGNAEDDTADFTSIISPDSRGGSSPAKNTKKRHLNMFSKQKDAIDKVRMGVKAVMQENAFKYKINTDFAIKRNFNEYVKNESNNGYASETNTVFKIFYDLFFENYFVHHDTPMPAFTFIKDQTLLINQYPLSAGQAMGLGYIFQRYSSFFNNEQKITSVDLYDCNLSDANFAHILKGLKNLDYINQIIYQQNEFKEKSADALITLLKTNSRDSRRSLASLHLISLKTNHGSMQRLLGELGSMHNLRKLRISDIDLSDRKVFEAVLSTVDNLSSLQ